jgi:uncharacterized membrane protein
MYERIKAKQDGSNWNFLLKNLLRRELIMKRFLMMLVVILSAVILSLAVVGCGGGGGGGGVGPGAVDSDNDGIADADDAFPNDATRFAAFTETQLTTPVADFTAAVAVSNTVDGVVTVVGLRDVPATGAVVATQWDVDVASGSAGAAVDLMPLAGETFSAAYDINDSGRAVGESSTNAGVDFVAVTWAPGSATPTGLPALAVGNWSAAYSVDNTGHIVGEAEDAGGIDRAVIWPAGSTAPTMLTDTLGSLTSSAYDINGSGMVVGEVTDSTGVVHAALWMVDIDGVQTEFADLGTALSLEGVSAIALKSRSGTVVGEYEDATGNAHAVEWTVDAAGAVVSATDLAATATESSASAVGGTRTVGWVVSGTDTIASLWDSRTTDPTLSQPILTSATTFSQAYDINGDNIAVGRFETATGDQAFVVIP